MNRWKLFVKKYPKTYLLACWALLGLAGALLGLGTEVTAIGMLAFGYVLNMIWMMRQ